MSSSSENDDKYNWSGTTEEVVEEEPSSESESGDDQSDLELDPLEFHRNVFMFELPDGSKTIFCRFSLVQIGGDTEGCNWRELDKLSAIILKLGGLIDRRYILTKNSNGEIDLQAKNPIGSCLREVAPETHKDIPILVGTFSPKIHQEFLRSFRDGLSQDIFNSQYLEDCWSEKKMINLDPLKYRVGKTIFEEYDPNLILKGEKKWTEFNLKEGQGAPAQIPIKSSPKRSKMSRVTPSASKSPSKQSSSSSPATHSRAPSTSVNGSPPKRSSPRKMAPTNYKINESTSEESDSKISEDEDEKASQNRPKRKFLEFSSSSKESQATSGSSKASKSASGSKESRIKSKKKRMDSKVKGKRAIIVEDSESESSEDEGEEESGEDIHVSILSEPSDGGIEANKESSSSKSDRSHKKKKKKSKGRVLKASPDFTIGNESRVKIDVSRSRKDPKNSRNGMNFSHWEKQKLVDYVCKYKLFDVVTGNSIWKETWNKGVLPHRNWQSMRESFNKRVLPNLHDFKIPDECKKELRRRAWLK